MISNTCTVPATPDRARLAGWVRRLSGANSPIERARLQASPRQSLASPSFINIKTQMKDHHHGKDIRNPGKARAHV